MITTQAIELSMTPEITVLPEVYCSQYDNGIRQVVFELFEDAEKTTPYNVDGLTAIVEGTKPDNNAYAVEAQASGSRVTVTITTQMAAVAGIVPSEIVLRDGSQRVGSLNFLLMVEPAGIQDGSVVSDSEIPAYVESAKEDAEAAATSQAAAAASQAAAAMSEANAAASETAAAESETNAASSEAAAAASQAAAATSEENAAESAAASEYWAQQSMEGKMLATLPDVSLPGTIPDGSLLRYDATSGKWSQIDTPLATQHGGTGNATGYVQAGASAGFYPGTRATAEGFNCIANGDYSHAEGLRSKALLNAAHAEGTETEANVSAHAEGSESKAHGTGSHAEGGATVARARFSHVGGRNVSSNIIGGFVHGWTPTDEDMRRDNNNPTLKKFAREMPAADLEGFALGYAPHRTPSEQDTTSYFKAIHMTEDETVPASNCGNGISATIGATAKITLNLLPGGIYLLFCNAFTLATGAIYGATARLISCLPTTDGTPNILSLGQTTNAPATIAAAANHTITIQNAAAARAAQFTLIRVA